MRKHPGGKDNYAVDREAAERVLAVVPDQRILARANRAFLVRAVRLLAESGIRQFVDLGTGIPTSPGVHEVACGVDASARTVYVDSDPIVTAHNDAMLAADERVAVIQQDIRRPGEILDDPRLRALINFDEPVGVLLVAVLHLIPDEQDPAGIVARFRGSMAPGSHLVLSQFSADSDPAAMAQLRAVAAGTPVETYFRPRDEILPFFDGFELVQPGLVSVEQWRPGADAPATRLKVTGGVGRKP